MLKHCRRALLCCAPVLFLAAGPAAAQTKLLRFPDIAKDRVVFTYAGDLWLASSAAGGPAARLTAHPGLELFAKFSPDGRWIAFTGQYDGDEQVYVIPSTGGVPKQLTFYPARGPLPPRWGYDNQVLGWSRDGKSVLFRSMRDGWTMADTRLYTVPVDGGLGEALPMPISGAGDFSPDGKRMVYTPFARDFRTWKRYQGGWAQDLWIFDLATHDAKNITSDPRNDRDPMWIGSKIFFASDRTGTLNLYSYDTAAPGAPAQLTRSTQWDVRWPSADEDGQIVYEQAGELNVLDTRSGQARHLAIQVPTDGLYDRPAQVSAAHAIEDAALSPKGERALFVARGDVFSAPIEKGVTRNLTRTPGAHDKAARWSPDGRKVAFLSDRSGEEEIWLIDQDGSGKPEQLTTGGKAMRYAPAWSPDGKRLAFSDKDGRLWVLTVADRKLAEVARERKGTTRDYVWSPGSNHLAFSLSDLSTLRSIWIWSVEDGKLRRVTDEMFHESNPAWSPDGSYLYFLSAREFAPQLDGLDFTYSLDRNIGIYALALRKDVANPFPPESDEVAIEPEKDSKDEKKSEKKAGPVPTRIDFDGLAGRVTRVPVPFDNYGDLSAADGKLLYTKSQASYLGRDPVEQPSLQIFTFKSRKPALLAESIDGYTLSADGEKVLVHHTEDSWDLVDATAQGKDSKKPVSTAGLVVDRVPAQEWPEIFEEAWRRYRDFFYVENMNGYDWAALHDQYKPLLAFVGHRSDLNYVIGEMIAELNISHAYIAGGDWQSPERVRVALPGARFELDKGAGRYRIAKIFQGQNEEDRYRSPLTEVGVDARVGDYVLAIDGIELKAADNPYRLLRGKASQPVRLTLNTKPSPDGAREVTFRPLSSETDLVYLDWTTDMRDRVNKLSNGRIGYVHMPDMGEGGLREFIKYFYGQIPKEGLLLDVRNNGGGFVSPILLDRLRRSVLGLDFGRLSNDPFPYPQSGVYNHMACLINEGSGSDGDIFPFMFREAGLGPVIGTRTWGGVVGISGHGPMIDGGQIFVPEAGSVSLQGEWIIEGHGVDPDIEVQNDPKSVLAGRDPQLERAVEEVMKKIQSEPRVWPKKPAGPDRTQAGVAGGVKKQ